MEMRWQVPIRASLRAASRYVHVEKVISHSRAIALGVWEAFRSELIEKVNRKVFRKEVHSEA